MPTLSSIVSKKTDTLDIDQVLKKYPWLVSRNENCIISPDSDGLLCGLMMSHLFGWKIQGFYDGKVLVRNHRVSAKSCVFLDMEIFRPGIRSVGQHILLYNKNAPPDHWDNFNDCFSINNFRNYDGCHDFRLKYPFGTLHFLATTIHQVHPFTIPKNAIYPVLFIDGTTTYSDIQRTRETGFVTLGSMTLRISSITSS